MRKRGLLTDTATDILQFPDLYKKLDAKTVYQYVNIGDETYTMENLSLDELLEKMNHADKTNWPRTSQPSSGDFLEIYESFKEEGYEEIIAIFVAGKFSGTMNSARLAAEQMDGIDIHLIDSQLASIGVIPCLLKTRQLMSEGMPTKEIVRTVTQYCMEGEAFAAVPRLDNLYKGGRLKPIRYRLGKLLRFKPIIRVSGGELTSYDKTRNLRSTQDKAYEYALRPYSGTDDFELIVAHAWAEETAKLYVERFRKEYPGKEVHLGRIGPAIGVHLGPEGLVFGVYRK